MALRGFWGFDSATIFRYPEFDNVHVAAATGRDGVANHATQWNNVNPSLLTIPGGAAAGLILGQAWQSLIASTPNTIRVAEFHSGGVLLGFIAGTGDGKLGFYSSAAVLMATSSVTFAPSVWHYLEIKFVPHATTGTCVIHSNELEVLSFTGNTTVSGLTTVDAIYFVSRNNFITDDMYLLDLVDETATAGRPNNDYLGDIRVAHCYPTSDGTTVTMTPSTAGVHAGLVDEVPPNTTDYVSALGGGTVKDLYQVTDLPSIAVTVSGSGPSSMPPRQMLGLPPSSP